MISKVKQKKRIQFMTKSRRNEKEKPSVKRNGENHVSTSELFRINAL